MTNRRRDTPLARWSRWLLALLLSMGAAAGADSATLRETYLEKYACKWDCPIDIPSIPGLDRDEMREELCDRICAERLRVSVSLNLLLTLPTLRHVDLRSVSDFRLEAGGLEFQLNEISRSASNSITFPQYREEQNDYGEVIRHRSGTVVFSKKADVLTIRASTTTLGESVVAGQFTHHTGTLHGSLNLDQVALRIGVGSTSVEREVEIKALTTIKTNLVEVEVEDDYEDDYEDEPKVMKEARTFSTVKVSGDASWGNPLVTVSTPAPAQRWSNEVITATGTALSLSDGLVVLLRLNDAEGWTEITPTGGLWSAPLQLVPGTNRLFVCARDGFGRFSSGVAVRFIHVRTSPVRLEILPGLDAGTVTGVRDGQSLEEGVVYWLTPAAAAGQLFEKWVLESPAEGLREIAGVTAPRLGFRHEANLHIRAYFVPNRFLAIPNRFAGLVRPSPETNPAGERIDQGWITFQLTGSGALQGSFVTARRTLRFRSQIHPGNGKAELQFDAGKESAALASLEFDLDQGLWVKGTLAGEAGWVSVVEAYPAASPEEVSPFVGMHTFVIPGAPPPYAAQLPAGFGNGTLRVFPNGAVKGMGAAGDGTKLVFNAPLVKFITGDSSPRYFWPFFRSEQRGAIFFRGFIELSPTNTFDAGSPFLWVKQPNFRDALYPTGFDGADFASAGGLPEWITARYFPPGRGTNTPGIFKGELTFSGGNLPAPVKSSIIITPNNKVTVNGFNPMDLKLRFTGATGAFSGTFLHPHTGKITKLAGVILQGAGASPSQNAGYGWFPGSTQAGAVVLEEDFRP